MVVRGGGVSLSSQLTAGAQSRQFQQSTATLQTDGTTNEVRKTNNERRERTVSYLSAFFCIEFSSSMIPYFSAKIKKTNIVGVSERLTMMDSSPRALSPNLRARSHTAWVTLSTLMLSL